MYVTANVIGVVNAGPMADAVTRRSKRLLKDAIRHAEVVREFERAQDQEQDPGEWPAAEHAAYLAPWRDRLADGVLGPWYGPGNQSQYESAMQHYLEGRSGGGLWDHETAAEYSPKAPIAVERDGLQDALLWFARHGHQLTEKHRAVFVGYWVDGLGYARLASRLNMSKASVRQVVEDISVRMGGK